MIYNSILYGGIDYIFRNISVRKGGSQMRKRACAMEGVVLSAHVRTMGGVGVNFSLFR